MSDFNAPPAPAFRSFRFWPLIVAYLLLTGLIVVAVVRHNLLKSPHPPGYVQIYFNHRVSVEAKRAELLGDWIEIDHANGDREFVPRREVVKIVEHGGPEQKNRENPAVGPGESSQ